ncbi:hypothetical protein EV645_2271 [Kribbella rubisoli]|uniref:Uncharacterized protein n=1 Tax=Kribbella rubisoli TaxID=3075929 RepID=A0A4Q7XA26_9ACTN|nr:hypothetical protein [Kribbella rubisoli]RZU20050.1 hypothetical protein EV645_2271 [Kribbella rubisoli]
MPLFATRRDLDVWADSLGVANDDEAVGVLQRLLGRLLDGQDRVRSAARAVSGAPSKDLHSELSKALGRIDLSVVAVEDALRGFQIHERR